MHRRKNAFVLITNKFVIKTNAFFAAIASVLVMKFKALEQLIFGVVVQPRCVVGPRVSPAYFVDCVDWYAYACPWTYAYTLAAIHAVNMRDKAEKLYQLHL